jgi:protease-4
VIRNAFLFGLFLLALSGCSGLNVSLLPRTEPLEEKVLEGEGKPKVLLIDLDGVISFKDESESLLLKKGPSKVAFFREALLKAEADPDIAGVIIRINSPGGSVAASDTIYHEIISFRQKKKNQFMPTSWNLAPQGLLRCLGRRPYHCQSTAITGSIGVIAIKFNMEGLFLKSGFPKRLTSQVQKKTSGHLSAPVPPRKRRCFKK